MPSISRRFCAAQRYIGRICAAGFPIDRTLLPKFDSQRGRAGPALPAQRFTPGPPQPQFLVRVEVPISLNLILCAYVVTGLTSYVANLQVSFQGSARQVNCRRPLGCWLLLFVCGSCSSLSPPVPVVGPPLLTSLFSDIPAFAVLWDDSLHLWRSAPAP